MMTEKRPSQEIGRIELGEAMHLLQLDFQIALLTRIATEMKRERDRAWQEIKKRLSLPEGRDYGLDIPEGTQVGVVLVEKEKGSHKQ